jgi:hypothetical protein
MPVGSSFDHLTAQNITVKMKFKMDIICVRLIILNFVYYGCVSDDIDEMSLVVDISYVD